MDILKIGAEILKSSLGDRTSMGIEGIAGVLQKLIGNGDQFDLSGLLGMMQSGGLASLAASWLGDGGNDAISPGQIREVIGDGKIADAAMELGTDQDSLLSGLAEAIPQMVDRASSGGSLLDSVGGLGGAMDMAKKLF